MVRLGISQERIAKGLNISQQTISSQLPKMPELAKLVNSDLKRGFSVSQVAEKHGWTEPMVWSLALEGKDDQERRYQDMRHGAQRVHDVQAHDPEQRDQRRLGGIHKAGQIPLPFGNLALILTSPYWKTCLPCVVILAEV